MKDNRFFITYLFVISAITVLLAFYPDYNWDMLPYMSIIQKMDGAKSFDKIHQTTYNTAQQNLPAEKYNDLVDYRSKYRKMMAENAAAFETQLPFFDIKPIYLISAFIFYKIGVSLTYATVLPSLISYFLINLVSFSWCKKFNLSFKGLIIMLFLISIITIPMATRSNPDTLACLFLLIGSYIFLETDNLLLSVAFLILSIFTRPESIIFCFLLFTIVLIAKWRKKINLFISIGCLLLMAAAYYLIIKNSSYPGWNNLFYHAFIDNTADPSLKQKITIPVYLTALSKIILNIKGAVIIVGLISSSVLIFLQRKRTDKRDGLYNLFYAVIISWAIVKTMLFPMLTLRFIIPPVLLLLFVAAEKFQLLYPAKNFRTQIINSEKHDAN
jgi:hypothetical protein